MKSFLKYFGALSLMVMLSSCGSNNDDLGNVAEVAQKNGFTALLAAVDKAGIASTLTAANADLTVLAPTDAAFGTLATQLGFANAGAMVAALPAADLGKILRYHVIPGARSSTALSTAGATLATAYVFDGAATRLALNTSSGVAFTDAVLARATVTTANVYADNGIIHGIDKVLIPPGVLNVVQMAQTNPGSFSSLVAAVVATGLAPALSASGPFTVFAPNNAAFASAPTGLTRSQLTSVLTYHVVPAQVLSTAIPFGAPVATLATTALDGSTVPAQTITINRNLTITDTTAAPATILATDVRASNGVIHVIGKVLIPK